MHINKAIISVIDNLIASIIYNVINGLINLQNNRIITLLLDSKPNAGNATLPLDRFAPIAFLFSQLRQKTPQFLSNF